MPHPSLKLPEPPAELAALSERLCTTLVNEIEADGPIPFQRYMRAVLYEPGLGYYVNGLHKFGASGDFVTAPEQGDLFGRALARRLDRLAESLDDDWTLLELGPGSGALARALLPALSKPPARYLMLEPSAVLRDVQHETLSGLPDELARRVAWIAAPPERPFSGAMVANEVIDALPVARFRIAEDGGIEECRVGFENGRFAWRWAPAPDRLAVAVRHVEADLDRALPAGYASEVCLDLPAWLETVCAPLARGEALFVDYGYPRSEYYHPDRGDGTLVCHYRHRAHFDPFVWPGLTDVSAFVDFTAVAEAARDCGLTAQGFTTQAGFVLGSGVGDVLEACDDESERMRLAAEFKRLVLPGEMGERFKVLAVSRGTELAGDEFALSDQLGRL